MMNLSKYLLTLAFCLAAFSAVACSDDSSSSAAADDGKKDAATWDDLQHFDDLADLPSCDKFEGVAAQVFDEKGFFVCSDNDWVQIGVSVPAYDKLPKCEAAMNDFCVYIEENEKIEASYICDEGEWVKGHKIEGSELCTKTDENSYEIEYNVSCMVKSNEITAVRLGDRRVGRGEVLSENANCMVLTLDDGRKRCHVNVDDYVCSGNLSDGTCVVSGSCYQVLVLNLDLV
ncbi:hypothetical protein [Fibrobacter sp.]|uniref:hypothetical protein n=1 Tax=Fibrobacter sp. TaxID=35828 RepID=UPI00388EE9BC